MRLRLAHQLAIAGLGCALAVLFISAISLRAADQLRASIEDADRDVSEAGLIAELGTSADSATAARRNQLFSTSDEERDRYGRRVDEAELAVSGIVERLATIQHQESHVSGQRSIAAFQEAWAALPTVAGSDGSPARRASSLELLDTAKNRVDRVLDELAMQASEESAAAIQAANETFRALLLTLLMACLSLGLAGGALVVWFGRRILGAVTSLATSLRAIAGGDLARRVDVRTGDELEDLGHSFNAMAEVLQRQEAHLGEQRSALERANSELEVQVAIRTAQLSDARDAAEHERATLAAIAGSMIDGLFVMDARLRVIYCNGAAGGILGVAPETMMGRSAADAFAQVRDAFADPEAVWAGFLAALKGDPSTAPFEATVTRPVRRDLLLESFPVSPAGQNDGGTALLMRDVTQERALARMQDELVATVSHELRTPLASLVGFVDLMLTHDYSEARRREFLTVMQDDGRRLAALITNFLDLQHMEGKAFHLETASEDPRALLERAIQTAGEDLLRPIVLEVDPGLPLVQANADAFLRVMANLFSNARKHSPDGGEIRVEAHANATSLEFAVRDQGVGIPSAALPQLFEKLQRVDNSDRREIKGAGLGLAICRRIVEAHGGAIRADSAGPGHGATFRFTLPLASGEVARHVDAGARG